MQPVSGIVCAACGHRNPPGANFCSSCGATLRDSAQTHTDTMHIEVIGEVVDEYDIDRSQFTIDTGILVVIRGPNAGSRFVLDSVRTTIGRHADSDIFLDDVTVSRRHAEIVRGDDASYVANDIGSLNGTYLNRTRVDSAHLSDGDELQIGMFKLVFLYGTRR